MARVRAVHHVMCWRPTGRCVRRRNRFMKSSAVRKTAIRLHREGDHAGNSGPRRSLGDADCLSDMRHRLRRHEVSSFLGIKAHLWTVKICRGLSVHTVGSGVSIATWPNSAVHHNGHIRRFPIAPNFLDEFNCGTNGSFEPRLVIADLRRPLRAGPEGCRIENATRAAAPSGSRIRFVVPPQCSPSQFRIQQRKGCKMRKVDAILED